MGAPKVLIVEDELPIRQMMKDILEIEGFNVLMAADGSEGIKQLRTICHDPCLVLLDLMMPGTNGWNFLDIQRNDPLLANIPVVICSAYAESARSVHPAGFVPKPIQLESLLEAVRAHCA